MPQKLFLWVLPNFSVPTLEALINSNHKVLTVYSQPASKSNRGQKLVPSSVEMFAKEKGLNLRTPIKLDTNEEYDFLKKNKPDIVVVVATEKLY